MVDNGDHYIDPRGRLFIDEEVGYGKTKKITREVVGVKEGEDFLYKTVFKI